MKDTIPTSKVYQFILIGLILILGWVLWKQLYFLFPSFLGALALYILLKKPMFWLINEKHLKDWMAATLLMLATVLIVAVPAWFIIKLALVKIEPLVSSPDFFTDVFKQINAYMKDVLGLPALSQDTLMKFTGKLTTFAQSVLSGTARTVMILVFMYVFLFFIMVNGRKLEVNLYRYMPFSLKNRETIVNEVTSMVRSNAVTIPSVALLQGSVALIGYLIFGINEPLLLGTLTAIASMIPIVGAAIVYLPVVVFTLAVGNLWQGIGLLLWCFILVGSVDNVARFLLQKKLADVHPVITILGVIVGTKLFGIIGLIFGPLMISLFVILVKIYFNEFGTHPDHKKKPEPDATE